MSKITIQVLSPKSLLTTDNARDIISTLAKLLPPPCVPDTFGTHEPFINHFRLDELEAVLKAWRAPSFFLSSERADVLCSISMTSPNWRNPPHSRIALSLPISAVGQDEVLQLLAGVSQLVHADFALAHILTDRELERGRKTGTVIGPILAVTTHNLRRNVPDLYWLTLFGKPYVELLGKETLLSTPAAEVREVGEGVLLQLTSDVLDLLQKPQEVDRLREKCKDHINQRIFFDAKVSPGAGYLVPHFETARE